MTLEVENTVEETVEQEAAQEEVVVATDEEFQADAEELRKLVEDEDEVAAE